jgi:hypothetical protein
MGLQIYYLLFAIPFFTNYSRSRRFGFREGSLERKPKINKETKKITVV